MGTFRMAVIVLAAIATASHADPPGATPPHPPEVRPPPPQAEPFVPPASSGPPIEVIDPSPNARTYALVGTGITGAIIVGEAYTLVRMNAAQTHVNELANTSTDKKEWEAAATANDRWHETAYVFAGLIVVSTAVTGVLWTRTETRYKVAVTPHGAYAGYARSF